MADTIWRYRIKPRFQIPSLYYEGVTFYATKWYETSTRLDGSWYRDYLIERSVVTVTSVSSTETPTTSNGNGKEKKAKKDKTADAESDE